MYELLHELPNDLRLRIILVAGQAFISTQEKDLGSFNKILEMLGSDGEYHAIHPKAKI